MQCQQAGVELKEDTRTATGMCRLLCSRAGRRTTFAVIPTNAPLTPKLTVRWKLRTRWTNHTCAFHHVVTLQSPLYLRTEIGSRDERETVDWAGERVALTALSSWGREVYRGEAGCTEARPMEPAPFHTWPARHNGYKTGRDIPHAEPLCLRGGGE